MASEQELNSTAETMLQFSPIEHQAHFAIFSAVPVLDQVEWVRAKPAIIDSTPVPARFFEIFEELTGWVVEFSESRSSVHRRQLVGSEHDMADGSFSIVDMSAQWPAQTPTAHRGKCDEMVGILERMASELHATRAELAQTRSVLEGLSPGTIDDDEVLVDTFLPTMSRLDSGHNDWGGESAELDSASEDGFVLADGAVGSSESGPEPDPSSDVPIQNFGAYQTIPAPAFLRSPMIQAQQSQAREGP